MSSDEGNRRRPTLTGWVKRTEKGKLRRYVYQKIFIKVKKQNVKKNVRVGEIWTVRRKKFTYLN